MTRRAFETGLLASALLPQARAVAQQPNGLVFQLLELPSGKLTRSWPSRERGPMSFGSLLKPFLVLAYGRTHESFPVIECHGAASGCWSSKGHGRQTLAPALANSCNTYFLALAASIDRAALRSTCLSFGLEEPGAGATAAELIGLRVGWPQTPGAVVEAFHRLMESRSAKTATLVLEGMRQCAARGTASLLDIDCFAKTGTAPCHHHPSAPGDGCAVVIYPRDTPRLILLAAKHGTTGAQTAAVAGELLRGSFRVPRRIGAA